MSVYQTSSLEFAVGILCVGGDLLTSRDSCHPPVLSFVFQVCPVFLSRHLSVEPPTSLEGLKPQNMEHCKNNIKNTTLLAVLLLLKTV